MSMHKLAEGSGMVLWYIEDDRNHGLYLEGQPEGSSSQIEVEADSMSWVSDVQTDWNLDAEGLAFVFWASYGADERAENCCYDLHHYGEIGVTG